MKRIAYIFSIVCMALGFAAWEKDDVAKNYILTVDVQLPEGVQLADITSAEIVVTNEQTGAQYTSEGVVASYQFTVPGARYNVTAAYRANDGGSVVSYNGAKNGIDVFADQAVTVELASGVTGGLVIKEIYYGMCKPNGKAPYMRDQFWEIYNNSDEVLYLDNCVLGMLEGSQGVRPTQWVENGEIMKEYAMGYYTVAFKGDGSGKTFPLEPGKSVVVANQAQNHTKETEAAYDPSVSGAMQSPVDLTNADFEVCLSDYKPLVAIDNQDVPNMTVIAAQGTQNYWTLPYTGNAVIIAKLPEGVDPVAYGQDEANFKEMPGSGVATKYLMIPQEYVLDGINIVNHDPGKRQIRLRSEVDAGSIWLTAAYTGKSLRRKVDHVEADGRVVYVDTNNSANDFLSDQVPAPGVIAAE